VDAVEWGKEGWVSLPARVDAVEWGKEGWVSLPACVNMVEWGKEGWVSPHARVDAVEWGKEGCMRGTHAPMRSHVLRVLHTPTHTAGAHARSARAGRTPSDGCSVCDRWCIGSSQALRPRWTWPSTPPTPWVHWFLPNTQTTLDLIGKLEAGVPVLQARPPTGPTNPMQMQPAVQVGMCLCACVLVWQW